MVDYITSNKSLKENIRDNQIDSLRVFAMVLVILTHSLTYLEKYVISNLIASSLYNAIVSFAFICNGLFFMISGYYTIEKAASLKTDEYYKFYWKRFSKIVIPAMLVGIVYYIADIIEGRLTFCWYFLPDYILRFISGKIASHYWFIYYIFAAYIISPFLGKMLISLEERALKIYAAILFLAEIVITMSFFSKYEFSYNAFVAIGLANWLFYYQLGYIVKRLDFQLPKRYLVALVTICIIVSVFEKKFWINNVYMDNQNVTMIVMTFSIFVLGAKYIHISNSRVLLFLSKHSYTTYLIHNFFVGLFFTGIISSIEISIHYLFWWLIGYLSIVIVSILSATIFDLIIIFPVSNFIQNKVPSGCIKKVFLGIFIVIIGLEIVMSVVASISPEADEYNEVSVVAEQVQNYIVINGSLDLSCDDFEVAVWSENMGQDDLVWYEPEVSSDGDLSLVVDLNEHGDYGEYIIHVYGQKDEASEYMCGTVLNVNEY